MGDIELFGIPVSLGTMVYQAFLFTVLTWTLHKFYIKKIVQVIEKRKLSIADQLTLAENYKRESEKKLQEQTELLNNARSEARIIIQNGRKDADQIIRNARKDAMKIRSQSFEDLRRRRSVIEHEKDIC